MLSVVTAFWQGKRRPWQTYTPECVNVLARMIQRNLTLPHDFVCLTDQPAVGFDSNIKLATLDRGLIPLGNAYPKIAVFKEEPQGVSGDRILFLDLDTVIVGSLDALASRPEPIVMLPEFIRSPRHCYYNTSAMLLDRGVCPRVWNLFDRKTSPAAVQKTGKVGSDQVWISELFGSDCPVWDKGEIVSFKYQCQKGVPPDARICSFHGRFKPWDTAVQRDHPWIVDYWH